MEAVEIRDVGDILDLIASNQSCGDPALEQHASDLINAREAGSTTKIGLDEVPHGIKVEEVEHRNVRLRCKCYRFNFNMGGRLGAISFKDAFAKFGEVQVRNGRHGTELYVVGGTEDVDGRDENTIYVIVGKYMCQDGKHVDAVFTWHPGEPLKSLEDGISEDTGVKVDFT